MIFSGYGPVFITSNAGYQLVQAHGGTMSPLTQKLSKLGCCGKFPANIERDLYRVLELPVAPYWLDVPARSQRDRQAIEIKRIPLLLPHEMYHYLFDPNLNQVAFCIGTQKV